MNHTTRPTFRAACISAPMPLAQRLRTAAAQLDAKLDAGEFSRLCSDRLVDLRSLVWMLDSAAVQAEAMTPRPQPLARSRPGWWRRWLGGV